MLPILGWFFAAPLKPRIHKALGHFPILCVWGTQGSGKSSLVVEVFWPLMGIRSAEPFSATETEFALLKLLSSTNSVPVFIDEYKPFDMPRYRRNTLHRYMRRLYTGEVESRGRADQTVTSYRLHAPLCLAGETRPIESSLVERIVTSNPSKDTLPENPRFIEAFRKLKTVDLGLLTRSIIRHLLGRDTNADLEVASRVVEATLAGREVPIRIKDNLIATVCGLLHYEGYGESMGIDLPELDVAALVAAQCDDLLESGGRTVKTGLDYFLEILSSLAVSGGIEHDRQYTYSGGNLALHVASCHAAYAEHCRRVGYEGEVLDKKALVRQLQENQRRGGFILEVSKPTTFGSRADRRRAAIVDLEAAKRLLDVDDFPQDDPGSAHGYGLLSLPRQVRFELSPGDRALFLGHVAIEACEKRWRVDAALVQGVPDIEEIASLLSLIERPQLGAEQLVDHVGRDLHRSAEPRVRDLEGHALDAELGEMLTGVDLDLEPELQRWRVLGLEAIHQVDPPLLEHTTRLPKPRVQRSTCPIQGLADGFRSDLDQIDVLRVPGRRREIELVQGGAAAKGQAARHLGN